MPTTRNKYEEIGDRIKILREGAKLSQQALAEKVGYTSGMSISHIEQGKRKVDLPSLTKIADVLHTTKWYLLGEQGKLEEQLEDKNIDFRFALRADKELSPQDKQKVLDYYTYIKSLKKK